MSLKKYTLLLLLLYPIFAYSQTPNTAKPWAYWWWLGSAVDEQGITKNLEDFAQAGFGGLHIIPIYGVKGEETKFIPYLSPKWVDMLEHTVKEGNRLGLGIDMTVGTGWPFGGSHVTDADAAKGFKIKNENDKYTLDVLPTKQKVKRAAPGAEGWVVDPFSTPSLNRYFHPFDSIFSKKNIGVRAFYNDSYEAYGANWTTDFLEKFKILRGYNLGENLDVLAKDTASTDREKQIWSDYHETLSDLLFEGFTKDFTKFAKKFGKITRNEAHGSPANILDLYALCDIPETEFFGSKPYNIPLYRQDPDYEIKRFGVPGDMVLKLASSAANVAGRKLVGSETATWLGNHFKVSLSQVKPIIDESFIGGVNHVFFHGIPYSPPNEPFPGWLFYASTNFNQQSHFWNALPQLNAYIEQCQKLLQNSQPDNDILVYFPIYDLWHTAGKNAKTHPIDVHSIIRSGMFNSPLGETVKALKDGGFSFDFVSDRQLKSSKMVKNVLFTYGTSRDSREGGTSYKSIVIPKCDYMPLETLGAIEKFQKAGIKVIFVEKLPSSVNGFFNHEKRQTDFNKIAKILKPTVAADLSAELQRLKSPLRQETMTQKGLTFIRKKTKTGTLYFIANQNQLFQNGTISLATAAEAVRLFDPLHQTQRFINFKKIDKNHIEIPLELQSGESVFIETYNKPNNLTQVANLHQVMLLKSQILSGNWQVDFIKGDPALPKSFTTETLKSWTDLSTDTMAQYFSGTARYTLKFDVSQNFIGKNGWLDLGDVRESAVVTLNGKKLGTAWCLPFKMPINQGNLKEKNNILEIDVTNLSINRIRYLDKQGVKWQKFYDINMVDINYRAFDASGWSPVASGLLGNVTLSVY